ncbi:MAG: thioredoxin domain-containing protein, partial [Isosphaeraceae bacterium]
MDLKVLLRHHARTGDFQAREAVTLTLDKMARGGIYDHLGGGFARYSTDDHWLVPHFEKMLYDNALLASVYLEAFQATGDQNFARVARETLDYVLRRMTGSEGAFYSTEDADSEGEEGKYYVWSLPQVRLVLGDLSKTFCSVYDVTEAGNWEGQNILNLPRPINQAAKLLGRDEAELKAELAADRARLLAEREGRVPPGKDEKVLVSWNGLLISALAVAGRALKDRRYLDAAARAAGFILGRMRGDDGRLLHTYKDGQAKLNAYLDDYADLIDGLTRLYEATGEPRWIDSALDLARVMIDEFADPEQEGFFFTGKSHEPLIARTKDLFDNATPSGNGMAATALLRLAALGDRDDLRQAGLGALEAVRGVIENAPSAAGQSLIALDLALSPVQQIVMIGGEDQQELETALETLYSGFFLPHAVIAPATAEQATALAGRMPVVADRPSQDNRTTTYICENFTCQEPVVGVDGLIGTLRKTGRGHAIDQ